jgi:hypothetical protein
MTTDVSQDRRVTALNQGSNQPALTDGSRPYWALPSPVYERSGYRASRPTGYKVMRSSCIVILGPVLASCLARHRNRLRCRCPILAPSSLRSRGADAPPPAGGLRPSLTAPRPGAKDRLQQTMGSLDNVPSRPERACHRARGCQGAAWKRWSVGPVQSDGRP